MLHTKDPQHTATTYREAVETLESGGQDDYAEDNDKTPVGEDGGSDGTDDTPASAADSGTGSESPYDDAENPLLEMPQVKKTNGPACPECGGSMKDVAKDQFFKGTVDGSEQTARTEGNEHRCTNCKIMTDGNVTMELAE